MKQIVIKSLQQAAWAPMIVLVCYATAAKVFNAYIIYPWLDIPSHFCGGLAITYFFLVTINNSQPRVGHIPSIVRLMLAVGLTAITAVVWEFLEYLSDLFLGSKVNLGVSDTLSDLFFGLLGAFFMVVFASRSDKFMSKNDDAA